MHRLTQRQHLPSKVAHTAGSVLSALPTSRFRDTPPQHGPRGATVSGTSQGRTRILVDPRLSGGCTQGHLPCGVASNEAQAQVQRQPHRGDRGGTCTRLSAASPPQRLGGRPPSDTAAAGEAPGVRRDPRNSHRKPGGRDPDPRARPRGPRSGRLPTPAPAAPPAWWPSPPPSPSCPSPRSSPRCCGCSRRPCSARGPQGRAAPVPPRARPASWRTASQTRPVGEQGPPEVLDAHEAAPRGGGPTPEGP